MSELKELLVESLQDLLNAENQLVGALPKMATAAHCSNLKQAFTKHLTQTEGHVERLQMALELLGEDTDSKPCKGMKGLIEEGQEVISDGEELDELTADLALIAAAQKVEHYEISGYGTARCLAKHLGERKVAKLLSHTLGEEESADFILTDLSQPLVQQALSVEIGNGTKAPWGEPGKIENASPANGGVKVRTAAAGGSHSRKKA
ncbi:MAG: ferritin-like domain-containing protein [Candidatus Acidiferrum sp.]